MKRDVKKPEERREEFLDTAERLFLERGYDSTTVTDVVTAMGLAKGAFYHYFASKEDVLVAIIERMVDSVARNFAERCEDEGLDAPSKLTILYGVFIRASSNGLSEVLHDERNASIHFELSRGVEARTVPILARLIEQGVSEGVFHVGHPEEVATVVFHIANLLDGLGNVRDAGAVGERLAAVRELTERVLGAEPGTFEDVLGLAETIEGM